MLKSVILNGVVGRSSGAVIGMAVARGIHKRQPGFCTTDKSARERTNAGRVKVSNVWGSQSMFCKTFQHYNNMIKYVSGFYYGFKFLATFLSTKSLWHSEE